MFDYEFSQIIDLEQVRQLVEHYHRITGMVFALLDTDENILVAHGWREVCTKFHRVNSVTSVRCRESDAYIKAHLNAEELVEYRCKNNMIDVAIPIVIDGRHLATFFTGQFFYDDDPPDRAFYRAQAEAFGFDAEEYLAALDKVPRFSRKHVHDATSLLRHIVRNLAEMGLKNLRLAQEMEVRKRIEAELTLHREHLEELVKMRTAELVEAKEQAEKANRAKSAFLAGMSHELRTPLNAVLGFAQLLKDAPDVTAKQAGSLDIIFRSGQHLLDLIDNVLDISKIESGRVELEESATDLHQIVQEAGSMMSARAKEKGLTFTAEEAPDLPRYVRADARKLRQVLINLIGNAIKFTQSGGVSVQVSGVAQEAQHMASIRFEVKDTGPGIPAADLGRIFQPFVQLTRQTPSGSSESGTGLGLAICKQYAGLMGGQLGVSSEPGNGSVFHFQIPVAQLPAGETHAAPAQGRVIGIEEGQPRYRILIADDQPDNRQLLRQLLEPFGFELREAAEGREALEVFEQWHPHLIWMDIRMPVMDGSEATRRIKRTPEGANTKVIALTAHALESERNEILAAGCDDFIRKPYKPHEIFDALSTHLGIRFRYAEAQPPAAQEKPCEVSAEHLRKLPPELIEELLRAAELLDEPRLLKAAGRVCDVDRELCAQLRRMVENMQLGKLLGLLDIAAAKGRMNHRGAPHHIPRH